MRAYDIILWLDGIRASTTFFTSGSWRNVPYYTKRKG